MGSNQSLGRTNTPQRALAVYRMTCIGLGYKHERTSLLEEAWKPQNGERHFGKAIEHEHDEGEEDHAKVELALGD